MIWKGREMLEQQTTIGSITLKNRFAMAPVDLEKSDRGTVSDEQLVYYDERTKGGNVGLVIVEHTFVLPEGRAAENQTSSADDGDVESLARIADLIHEHGSPCVVQLSHAGLRAPDLGDGLEGISPSGMVGMMEKSGLRQMRALATVEIDALINAFANAAVRAKKAGFDGVELHSAHGYLLNQFYSPLTNLRTDEYGSRTVEDRVRLHCQIIDAVREELGADSLVGIRFGACDYMDGGSTIEDGVVAAMIFEQHGVDFIDVSGGLCGSRPANMKGAGFFGDAASAIKKSVSMPVVLAGGVKTREDAERLLNDGVADIIAVARAIIADPSWGEKALSK